MSPVRGREGIIDVKIAKLGQIRHKILVIGFFTGMEPQIFQQDHIAGLKGGHSLLRNRTNTIADKGNRRA